MKKLLAILLALMLVLVNVAVLAEDDEEEDENIGGETPAGSTAGWVSDATTFSTNGFKKLYTVSGTSTTIYPDETLTFTSTPDNGNPDTTNVTITPYTPAALEGYLTVNIPSYSKVGIYKYTIAEDTPTNPSQAVTYATTTVGLTVLVEYDYTNKKLVPSVIGITKNSAGVKDDTFNNTYELGEMTVTKQVSGNLASQDAYFDIAITLTATNTVNSDITVSGGTDAGNAQTIAKGWTEPQTVNIKLKHGETVTLTNIPTGVTYSVAENTRHEAADPNGTNPETGYTISYDSETGTISTTASAATVTNTKDITVDTGVTLDSAPYVLMMALALIGVAMLFVRKREEY